MLSLIEQIDVETLYLSRIATVNYRGFKLIARTVPNFLVNSANDSGQLTDILRRGEINQNDDVLLAALRKISKNLGV